MENFEKHGFRALKDNSSSKCVRSNRDHLKDICREMNKCSEEGNKIYQDSNKIKEVLQGKQPEVQEQDLHLHNLFEASPCGQREQSSKEGSQGNPSRERELYPQNQPSGTSSLGQQWRQRSGKTPSRSGGLCSKFVASCLSRTAKREVRRKRELAGLFKVLSRNNHDNQQEFYEVLNQNNRRELYLGLGRQERIKLLSKLTLGYCLDLYQSLDDQNRIELYKMLDYSKQQRKLYKILEPDQQQALVRKLESENHKKLY
jgi:hypothetical protein